LKYHENSKIYRRFRFADDNFSVIPTS